MVTVAETSADKKNEMEGEKATITPQRWDEIGKAKDIFTDFQDFLLQPLLLTACHLMLKTNYLLSYPKC